MPAPRSTGERHKASEGVLIANDSWGPCYIPPLCKLKHRTQIDSADRTVTHERCVLFAQETQVNDHERFAPFGASIIGDDTDQ